jgi:aminobenzoyl-glutamate utilization protein B
LEAIWKRVEAAAHGAATGTGTEVDWEIIHGNYSLLPNDRLSRSVDANLRRVGGVHYDFEERIFAEAIQQTIQDPQLPLGSETKIQPYETKAQKGSTDVGDVSWAVPTAGFNAATWVPGTGAHSWQAVAAGGTGIGTKGMLVAAKTLALTAIELLRSPEIIQAAREEFDRRRGKNFHYRPLVGDREPPLDYRR